MRDSWAEYDEASSKAVHERPLHYLCYVIECINPDTGEKLHFFKAIKFLRVIRLPKGAKQSTSLMDMHTQITAGANENAYNLVTVIANIIKPIPLGLLFLYGVQGQYRGRQKESACRLYGTQRNAARNLPCDGNAVHLRSRERMAARENVWNGIPDSSKRNSKSGSNRLGWRQ